MLGRKQFALLLFIDQYPDSTVNQVYLRLGASCYRTAQTMLNALVAKGFLRADMQRNKQHYRLTPLAESYTSLFKNSFKDGEPTLETCRVLYSEV